jgi:7-carboxy-7-deazaguanine synthase
VAYIVKEIFATLQGEGVQSGRAAVFLRFAGCNLWTGRDEDRESAECQFCDTDFVGGERYDNAAQLASAVMAHWRGDCGPFVVITGGEPALQLDQELVDALHDEGAEIAVETNGTKPLPEGIDWICVSPKAGTDLVVRSGDELKLVYPQLGAEPGIYADLEFGYFLLQPMDGPDLSLNVGAAMEYVRAHPQWRLSLQTHKIIGIP